MPVSGCLSVLEERTGPTLPSTPKGVLESRMNPPQNVAHRMIGVPAASDVSIDHGDAVMPPIISHVAAWET